MTTDGVGAAVVTQVYDLSASHARSRRSEMKVEPDNGFVRMQHVSTHVAELQSSLVAWPPHNAVVLIDGGCDRRQQHFARWRAQDDDGMLEWRGTWLQAGRFAQLRAHSGLCPVTARRCAAHKMTSRRLGARWPGYGTCRYPNLKGSDALHFRHCSMFACLSLGRR